jgi:hypothetical protein
MDARTILTVLPGPGPHERLAVALVPARDGRLMIDLCQQHYAEGIGWFDQRTLSLEPAQFKRLQAALGLKAAAWDDSDSDEPPATIAFPGPSDRGVRRPAVGDGG